MRVNSQTACQPNSGHCIVSELSLFLQGHVLVSRRWVIAVNALVRQWDRVSWLFPPVPLIPEAIRIVEEQQIEAVLVCPGWKGSSWWLQLSVLRKQDPVRVLSAARYCWYPMGHVQTLPTLYPL